MPPKDAKPSGGPRGIDEFLLPRALVAKIAKESLPENTPLPRDGVTVLMRSATMFTSYITAEAASIARVDNRKTVTHTDILRALEVCNFAALAGPAQELAEKAVAQKTAKRATEEEEDIEEDAEPEDASSQPDAKRARTETAETDDEMQDS